MSGPKRAFEVTICWGGDTWEDVMREVERSVEHLREHGPECSLVSGAPNTGGWVRVHRDAEMSSDRYFEQIEEWKRIRADAALRAGGGEGSGE